MYFYTYVLKSLSDSKFYTGYTKDLKNRLKMHNEGRVKSTKRRRPFELVYFEACKCQNSALIRERYLKTTYGKRYLKKRINEDCK